MGSPAPLQTPVPDLAYGFVERSVCWQSDQPADAFAVKPDQYPTEGQEDRRATAEHKRPRVVHFELPPAMQFYPKHAERLRLPWAREVERNPTTCSSYKP